MLSGDTIKGDKVLTLVKRVHFFLPYRSGVDESMAL